MTAPTNPRWTDSPFREIGPDGKPMAGSQPICGAKKVVADSVKSDRCQNPAGLGTRHPGRGYCKLHFGATPAHEEKALIEEAMEHQEVLAAGFRGYPVEVGPHEALLEEVRRTAGKVRYIDNALNTGLDLKPNLMQEMRRDLFRERTHLVNACSVAARAGVEERAIRLAEMWGQEIAALFSAVFADLRLTPEQADQAPEIVQRHLAVLENVA